MHASPVSQNRRSTRTPNEFVSQNERFEPAAAPLGDLEFADPPFVDQQAA